MHKHALSCVWLCELMNYSLPDSSVHGILQARILEWVAISFSRGSSQLRDWTHISCVSCIGRQILYHQHHLSETFLPKYATPHLWPSTASHLFNQIGHSIDNMLQDKNQASSNSILSVSGFFSSSQKTLVASFCSYKTYTAQKGTFPRKATPLNSEVLRSHLEVLVTGSFWSSVSWVGAWEFAFLRSFQADTASPWTMVQRTAFLKDAQPPLRSSVGAGEAPWGGMWGLRAPGLFSVLESAFWVNNR